jgi:hypothetical protein
LPPTVASGVPAPLTEIRKLGTLLHETAHGLANARKVSDTSRQRA